MEARRILCVGADCAALRGVYLILHARRHEAFLAENGDRALEMARSLRPHLVILDMTDPALDGDAVREGLRRMGMAGVPTIMLVEQRARRNDSEAEGEMVHRIAKPVDPDLLLKAVDCLLDGLGRDKPLTSKTRT